MPVGSVAICPRGCVMFGFAREETIIQVNAEGPWTINYINPADDPRKKRAREKSPNHAIQRTAVRTVF